MENLGGKLTEGAIEALSSSLSEPKWLLSLRKKALGKFTSLPLETSPLYRKYADERALDWERMELDPGKQLRLPEIPGEKIIITSINSAVRSRPELLQKILSNEQGNKAGNLNSAAFSAGYFILVPKNARVREPVVLKNEFGEAKALIAHKNIVILGENSSLALAEEHHGGGEGSIFSSSTEVHAAEGAEFKSGCINLLGGGAISLLERKIVLGKNAKSASVSGFFGGEQTISVAETIMEGEGSSGEDFAVVLGAGGQKFSITSNISNLGKNSTGKVMMKGIYREKAKGLFKGMAFIGKDAKGANSYLAGHSMLMGRETSSDAIPALQIENNDVKATHSASVAQVDEGQLFYLESRGIGKEEAKRMIARGFVEPLLQLLPLEKMRTKLRAIFELKWEGKGMDALERRIMELEWEEKGNAMRIGGPQARDAQKEVFEGHYKYR